MNKLFAGIALLAMCGIATAQDFPQTYSVGPVGFFGPLTPTGITPNTATDYVNLGQINTKNPQQAGMNTGFWLSIPVTALIACCSLTGHSRLVTPR